MVELFDDKNEVKIVVMIFGEFRYQGKDYVLYCVRREGDEANLFVSKLVRNSVGYVMDYHFENGEKEVVEEIIQKLINQVSLNELEKVGFSFLKDVTYDSILHFDMEICYVATIPRKLVKEMMIYYGLVTDKLFDQPVVDVLPSRKKFQEGFASNIVLIVFGLFLIGFCFFVIYEVVFS